MNSPQYHDPDDFVDPLSEYEPVIYPSAVEEALAEGAVSDIRTTPYAEIPADATVRNAVYALYGLKIASLMVVDQGKLVGVFTERDVLERIAESFEKLAERPIRDFMTKNPVVVEVDSPPGAALSAIAAGGYRHVPVVDHEYRVVGVISPRRVFDFLEAKFAA